MEVGPPPHCSARHNNERDPGDPHPAAPVSSLPPSGGELPEVRRVPLPWGTPFPPTACAFCFTLGWLAPALRRSALRTSSREGTRTGPARPHGAIPAGGNPPRRRSRNEGPAPDNSTINRRDSSTTSTPDIADCRSICATRAGLRSPSSLFRSATLWPRASRPA